MQQKGSRDKYQKQALEFEFMELHITEMLQYVKFVCYTAQLAVDKLAILLSCWKVTLPDFSKYQSCVGELVS